MGVVAGYLVWSGRCRGPQAIAAVEHLVGHPMGPPGREMVARAGGRAAAPPARARPVSVSDRIEIRGLRVTGCTASSPRSRTGPSPSRSTSTLLDIDGGQRSDDLADTADYGARPAGGRRGRRPVARAARVPGRRLADAC